MKNIFTNLIMLVIMTIWDVLCFIGISSEMNPVYICYNGVTEWTNIIINNAIAFVIYMIVVQILNIIIISYKREIKSFLLGDI